MVPSLDRSPPQTPSRFNKIGEQDWLLNINELQLQKHPVQLSRHCLLSWDPLKEYKDTEQHTPLSQNFEYSKRRRVQTVAMAPPRRRSTEPGYSPSRSAPVGWSGTRTSNSVAPPSRLAPSRGCSAVYELAAASCFCVCVASGAQPAAPSIRILCGR